MKALRTKVILSGIVLVFAFIATIGTTFAWFTVSQTATVETMTLNVTSADNLLIKAYDGTQTYIYDTGDSTTNPLNLALASSYQTSITNVDLYEANYLGSWDGSTLSAPWRISPTTVAVGDGSGNYGKDFDILNSDIQNSLRSYSAASANANDGDYIELKFWLYTQSEDSQLVSLKDLWVSADTGNSVLQDDVVNSVRLSVWAAADGVAETARTTDNDANLFGLTDDYDYSFTGIDGFDFTDWNTYISTNMVALHAATAPAVTTVGSSTNSNEVFTIAPLTPTLITVVIYVEGWQIDADNNISEAAFDIYFGFEGTPVV